ncbi:MAG: type II toxin-antitoxin system RelB/DinJ family antitoxin, partial [Hafniaceae bacterium]|nr:type II toxin-antitoxin system RelB/DinJ family antitoxin [Hafniaceae bacterium]
CSYIYGYKTLSSWSEVMTKSDVVRARVSPAVKVAAMENASALGTDLSTIIRLLVNQIAVTGEVPAELLKPNAKTLKAIRDLEAGVGVNRASDIDELKADLGW